MRKIFFIFSLLIHSFVYSQQGIWLIGTAHKEERFVNADSLTAALDKVRPDLILMELEEEHFTNDFKFNTEKYQLNDFLVGIENLAIYRYQQKNGTQLRPFDINGRHTFYQKENYQERENQMFGEMLTVYKSNKFSESCKVDFEILLSALSSYSELKFNSLREANSDVATKFHALKNKINFELTTSIVMRTQELSKWLSFAKLRMDYWDRRNQMMAMNIIKYANEFKGKRIVVMVGNDHKYALLEILTKSGFEIKNYYE